LEHPTLGVSFFASNGSQLIHHRLITPLPTRVLIFPRVALAAAAWGGKESTIQQFRLNCLAVVINPLGELIACIHRQVTTDGLSEGAPGGALLLTPNS